ncbi:MAG: TIGR03986 family CRISPR-associated RAMP protein [Proteobacteria bacterium]|nr:TIGR03986 family CRISPR-associated RAMP protein [Pseudomonadota bacterium]
MNNKNFNSPIPEFAYAPYNFVSLNDKIIPADTNPKELDFSRYHLDRNTGYIDLTIETLTPLYIRNVRDKNSDKAKENSDFFSPASVYSIPGSSIKGMVRTLVEILSHSRMSFIDKEVKYHFRTFADRSLELRDEYKKILVNDDRIKGYSTKAQGGYLKKIGNNKYVIHPAKSTPSHFRVEEQLAIKAGVIKYKMSDKEYKSTAVEVYFKPEHEKSHKHSQVLFYAKVTDIKKAEGELPKDFKRGYLVCSGFIGHKSDHPKHMHWVIGEVDFSRTFEIPADVIDNYKKDELRDSKTNLLDKVENNKVYPCFYTLNNNKVSSFGNTGFYRVPYSKAVGDLLPSCHKEDNSSTVDMAVAIFGNEKDFAGRVTFCNAKIVERENFLLSTVTPKILSAPKPTCFQHYLEQDRPDYTDPKKIKGLKNYNSPGAKIRGHKLYWHKSNPDYIEKDIENIKSHPTQYTRITPVKQGVKFKGRIYFENLSDVELGALLTALDLPDGLAHKIGMAKPLGLGSVKIRPLLYFSDRRKRYRDFFSEIDSLQVSNDIEKYKKTFESYILKSLNSNAKTIWDIERIRKLKILLDYKNQKKNTNYMNMLKKSFRERKVLPPPEKVW